MRIRLLILASASALLVSAGFAATTPALGTAHKRPRIKSGRYVDGINDVYLDVDVKARGVQFHFTLYCNDLFADQWVSSGPEPVRGTLSGNRRGGHGLCGRRIRRLAGRRARHVPDRLLEPEWEVHPPDPLRGQGRIRSRDLPRTDGEAAMPRREADPPRPPADGLSRPAAAARYARSR